MYGNDTDVTDEYDDVLPVAHAHIALG